MNKYLKRIDRTLTDIIWEEQFKDMNLFRRFIFANFLNPSFEVNNEPSGIGGSIFPEIYKVNGVYTNIYRDFYLKLHNSYLTKSSECEQQAIERIEKILSDYGFFKDPFTSHGGSIWWDSFYIKTSEFLEEFKSTNVKGMFLESKFEREYDKSMIFVSDEPNWKHFKNFCFDLINSTIEKVKKEFKLTKPSESFIKYFKGKFDILEQAFEDLTPINKQIKLNAEGLKDLVIKRTYKNNSPERDDKKSTGENAVNALLQWKEFLSDINAETNVKDVKLCFFPDYVAFLKMKRKYDFAIIIKAKTGYEIKHPDIVLMNFKTNKCKFITPKSTPPKSLSIEMLSDTIYDESGFTVEFYDQSLEIYGVKMKDMKLCTNF